MHARASVLQCCLIQIAEVVPSRLNLAELVLWYYGAVNPKCNVGT